MKDIFKSKKLSDDDMGKVSGGARDGSRYYYYCEERWDSICHCHPTYKHQWEFNTDLKKFVCPNCSSICSDRKPSP